MTNCFSKKVINLSTKDFKFEYGGNVKLKKQVSAWKNHEDYRGYCIVAPSEFGKTALLKELGEQLPHVEYLEGFQVMEKVYQDIRQGKRLTLPIDKSCEVLLVDHLDDIEGREAMIREIRGLMRRNAYNDLGDGRLIICTFRSERVATAFAEEMNYGLVFMKKVKPNLRIVREKAADFKLRLTKEQVYALADVDSMFELRNAFRELGCKSNEPIQYKLILTSRGLNTTFGKMLLKRVFEEEDSRYGRIFLMTMPSYEVDEKIVNACEELGFTDIYLAGDYEGKEIGEMPEVDFVYCTEGNTFEVVDYARKHHFDDYIKEMLSRGATYIGASAGAIYASSSFKEAENFDSNYLRMTDFTGLCLLPGTCDLADTVIPHYTFRQLRSYVAGLSDEDIARYINIYNICNEEAFILDCKKVGETVVLIKKRRIRIE